MGRHTSRTQIPRGASLSWNLPYAASTHVWYVQGFHGDNWAATGSGWNAEHVFTLKQQNDPTSIDLAPADLPKLGVPVYPLAKGKVIGINPGCHAILIDHGYNIWTIYLHLNASVSVGQVVSATDSIGCTASPPAHPIDKCEYSSGPHVHIAFLEYIGSNTAKYVSMAGKTLCGQTVQSNGAIGSLASPGGIFAVPANCGSLPPPAPTSTPARPIPTPPGPPTPGQCSTPMLLGPGNASFEQTTDITLSWTTDCPQSYAELWGGPYGTVSFGGWQAATSIHIGQMYVGTYMWHVKGRSSDGNETGWSDTWSFAIASNPPPNSTPTDTPVPYATATPTPVPQPTATSTPCPYADNHGQFPTFYASPDWQGQSVSFSINPGQDTFFIFPNWLQQNLESFTDPYGAFHLVTYHTTDHGGNLAHWDSDQPGPLPNTDGYQLSASVESYFHRTC